MLCYFLPPLVAINALTKDDVCKIVANLGNQAAGIQTSIPNRIYNSLHEEGPDGNIAQVLADGAKLKAFIKCDRFAIPTGRRASNESADTERLIDKFKPAYRSDMSPLELSVYEAKMRLVKVYQDKRAQF